VTACQTPGGGDLQDMPVSHFSGGSVGGVARFEISKNLCFIGLHKEREKASFPPPLRHWRAVGAERYESWGSKWRQRK
jgi:hypothetical protein